MTLTGEQQRAVDTDANLVCVLSCPGSGKTLVVSERVKRLIRDGVPPETICAVTYTVSAAHEMSKRIGHQIGVCDTLHGLMLKLLREHGHLIGFKPDMTVLDEETSDTFIEEQCRLLKFRGSKQELKRALLGGIPEGDRVTPEDLMVGRIYHTLHRTNLLTYDAILVFGLKLLQALRGTDFEHSLSNPVWYEHLIVDEIQDASDQDWKIYNTLNAKNIFMVGDPSQCLFQWRNGSPEHIIGLSQRKECEVHRLTVNFRSGQSICDAANALFPDHPMRTGIGIGGLASFSEFATQQDEVFAIANLLEAYPEHSWSILLRTNSLVDWYREQLSAFTDAPAKISTVHQFKGKEADGVICPAFEEDILPLKGADLEEEKRIAFVAATRAKTILIFTCCRHRTPPWGFTPQPAKPSPFIKQMGL